MVDDTQSALRALLGNRVVQVIAVIMALLAIYIEGMAAWRATSDAVSAHVDAQSKSSTPADLQRTAKTATGTDSAQTQARKLWDQYYDCKAVELGGGKCNIPRPTITQPDWNAK